MEPPSQVITSPTVNAPARGDRKIVSGEGEEARLSRPDKVRLAQIPLGFALLA